VTSNVRCIPPGCDRLVTGAADLCRLLRSVARGGIHAAGGDGSLLLTDQRNDPFKGSLGSLVKRQPASGSDVEPGPRAVVIYEACRFQTSAPWRGSRSDGDGGDWKTPRVLRPGGSSAVPARQSRRGPLLGRVSIGRRPSPDSAFSRSS